VQRRLDALVAVARFHGHELDGSDFRGLPGEAIPSPAALVTWLRESGLWAKAVRLRWRQLFRFQSDAPLVLLFSDGSNHDSPATTSRFKNNLDFFIQRREEVRAG
jgi:ATP-binding cassette, subfamily B, bacterial HlyB/CyaB